MRRIIIVCVAALICGAAAGYALHPYCGITEEDSAAVERLILSLQQQRKAEKLSALTARIVKYCQVPEEKGCALAGKILDVSDEYGVDPKVLAGIMIVESHGLADAKNGTCVGLMQVNAPVWRKELRKVGISDIGGIEAGAYILSTYLRQANGNLKLALARYSGGARGYVGKVYRASGLCGD